jgi:glycosyltransferase involved in cell wall biosynthesis
MLENTGGLLAEPSKAQDRTSGLTVAVIIPCFNHRHFLAEAISSALTQTRPPDEVIIVDDGSTDDPTTIVERFPGVRLIRQENRGPSEARNTGLWNCSTSYVTFLDADDRLLPHAIETGLACACEHPECAFVYGGYRKISHNGVPSEPDQFVDASANAYLKFLRGNFVGMCGTVLYRRDCLIEIKGFDEGLRLCEDYDVYLRMSSRYPIAAHSNIIAEYRWHDQNTSQDHNRMLKSALAVLNRHEADADCRAREAIRDGRANWRHYYAVEKLKALRNRRTRGMASVARELVHTFFWSPRAVMDFLNRILVNRAKRGFRLIG